MPIEPPIRDGTPTTMLTRRDGLKAASLALAAAMLPGFLADAALAQTTTAADLAQEGPLGDVWLGAKDAKVTVIEYASMTCSHCAHFHKESFPALKSRWIDTGKVRFALREFPLDPLATAAFMLARCDGAEKYYPVTDMLFDQQQAWAFVDKPVDALERMMLQAGVSKERFEACLKDQRLYDAVNAVKKRGVDTFKINSTPTFFIDGERHKGAITVETLASLIEPKLAK